ncbi:uncharacterized protein LOC135464681 [Liolophura sinensis]|uniref:uncharacterized protein LOC135464681 n=1 Tax=Liolophura sinensis TaxID=3198878 RepID=UPI003158AD94
MPSTSRDTCDQAVVQSEVDPSSPPCLKAAEQTCFKHHQDFFCKKSFMYSQTYVLKGLPDEEGTSAGFSYKQWGCMFQVFILNWLCGQKGCCYVWRLYVPDIYHKF